MSLFSFHSFIARFKQESPLYFVHRLDNNIGDRLAAPYLYYDFPPHTIVDICNKQRIQKIPAHAHVVVGGGGLMMPYFDPYRKQLLERNPSKMVWWAVGERRIQNLNKAYINEVDVQHSIEPNWFLKQHLVGFRQTTPHYPFLPCVSCKAVEQYKKQYPQATLQHEAVFFEHRHVPLPKQTNYPLLNNEAYESEAVLAYLDSAPIVVTNSYHGMYWALLLGKQVIVVPFSSGLYHNPWPVYYTEAQNLMQSIQSVAQLHSPTTNALLPICIEQNDLFYQSVLTYFASSK